MANTLRRLLVPFCVTMENGTLNLERHTIKATDAPHCLKVLNALANLTFVVDSSTQERKLHVNGMEFSCSYANFPLQKMTNPATLKVEQPLIQVNVVYLPKSSLELKSIPITEYGNHYVVTSIRFGFNEITNTSMLWASIEPDRQFYPNWKDEELDNHKPFTSSYNKPAQPSIPAINESDAQPM